MSLASPLPKEDIVSSLFSKISVSNFATNLETSIVFVMDYISLLQQNFTHAAIVANKESNTCDDITNKETTMNYNLLFQHSSANHFLLPLRDQTTIKNILIGTFQIHAHWILDDKFVIEILRFFF
jgi:hypothetical protein